LLYSFVSATQSHKTATHWGVAKSSDASKKFHDPRRHYIDRKHTFLYVKFESALFPSFTRACMSKEKVALFHQGWSIHFPKAGFEHRSMLVSPTDHHSDELY
jgi:hypothetical protein